MKSMSSSTRRRGKPGRTDVKRYLAATLTAVIGLATSLPVHAMGPIFPTGGQFYLPPPPPPACTKTQVSPPLATDGQRVYLDTAEAQENMQVLLSGYRYNDAPPTTSFPDGEGREEIYCGCQRVKMETLGGGDPEFSTPRPYITVPMDAPTGDYSVEILPASVSCSSGGIRATCDVSQQCKVPSLSVAPSFIVSTTERLDITGNSEETDDHPAEMAFLFTAGAGTTFGDGERLVEWTGSFPGGGTGSTHITHADNTTLRARVPLFAGRESLMNVVECREECIGVDDAAEAACIAQCDADQNAGRYNNKMAFGFGGVEYDSSPSKAWGVVAGIAASALVCVGGAEVGLPCDSLVGAGSATAFGTAVAVGVNQLLQDDDDNLGLAEAASNQSANWNVGATFGPLKLDGQDSGDISLYYRNHRVPAPRILNYSVRLKSIKLLDDYEENDCRSPNEVFINARAALHQGESTLPGTIRIPSGNEVFLLAEGETHTFGPTDGVISSRSFTPETAPISPFLYVEVGVWENDKDKDLMGIEADTMFLGQYISAYMDSADDTTSEGYRIRHATFTRVATVHGYAGSDNHCWGWGAHGWDPQAVEGGARVEYQVDLTWLKAPFIN